nr:hypothetical protein [Tanacetum cinerariifolium]
MREEDVATWDGGNSTWGGQVKGFGTVPVCVSVQERAGGEGRVLAGKVAKGILFRVEGLENVKAAQQLEIVNLKARVKQLEKINKVAAASTPIPAAKSRILTITAAPAVSTRRRKGVSRILTITAAPAVSTRRRKGVVIRDPKKKLHSDTPAGTPTVKDKGKGILIEAPKPMKKKDQIEMDADDSPLLGVNTLRSDEDRLKLMELMVFLMKKGVCDEFILNAARLFKFLLSGKCDVTRLQALVDKKRIVISEEVVREILQLNDAEGVICLPNEETFARLARMGYEKPSTKLTFYKAFFSTQWKFFIHTILHSLSQRFNFSKYIFESLVRNVDSSSKFYMYPRFIQLIIQTSIADLSKHTNRYISPVLTQKVFANMRRVGKEEVANDVVPPTPTSTSPSSPVLDTCSALAHRVEFLENDKVAQQLEIVKLKARVKKLEKINKDEGIELVVDHEKDVEVEGRHADKQAKIYNIDLDHSSKVLSMQEDDTEVQEAVEVVTTDKLITEVVTAATTQVVAASIPILAAKPKILKIADAPVVSTKRRKGVVIRDSEEKLHSDTPAETPTEEFDKEHEEAYKNIDWNAALDHVQSKEPQYIKRYHGIKKTPQSESEARKNMISYLKSTEGYKMEFFKGKTYDEILPIFQARFDANMKFLFKSREEMEKEDEEIIKSINETPAQKAAKRRKLSEEAQEADDL